MRGVNTHIAEMIPDQTPDRFQSVAQATVEGLPEAFQPAARDVVIRVSDWPDRAMLLEVGLTHPQQLTGMYEGVPVTQKSVFDQPVGPDVVWLFREPILAEWRQRGDVDLDDLIAHVTIHEFAHHFGWSDADIARIDRWWD